jgi:hypothetical protein
MREGKVDVLAIGCKVDDRNSVSGRAGILRFTTAVGVVPSSYQTSTGGFSSYSKQPRASDYTRLLSARLGISLEKKKI